MKKLPSVFWRELVKRYTPATRRMMSSALSPVPVKVPVAWIRRQVPAAMQSVGKICRYLGQW